jgi:hypothetical protein
MIADYGDIIIDRLYKWEKHPQSALGRLNDVMLGQYHPVFIMTNILGEQMFVDGTEKFMNEWTAVSSGN